MFQLLVGTPLCKRGLSANWFVRNPGQGSSSSHWCCSPLPPCTHKSSKPRSPVPSAVRAHFHSLRCYTLRSVSPRSSGGHCQAPLGPWSWSLVEVLKSALPVPQLLTLPADLGAPGPTDSSLRPLPHRHGPVSPRMSLCVTSSYGDTSLVEKGPAGLQDSILAKDICEDLLPALGRVPRVPADRDWEEACVHLSATARAAFSRFCVCGLSSTARDMERQSAGTHSLTALSRSCPSGDGQLAGADPLGWVGPGNPHTEQIAQKIPTFVQI